MNTLRSGIKLFAFIFALPGILLFSSCANSAEKNPEAQKEEPVKSIGVNEVSITRQQFEALKIEFGGIEQKNLHDNMKATGVLKVVPQSKANITSALGGTVQSILIQEGDKVTRGQTVVTLTNPEFIKMQEEFLSAGSQLSFAEAEYRRQKELASNRVAAQKTFQQAESEYNSLRVKYHSLKRQLAILNLNTDQLTYDNIASTIDVVSPINGNISDVAVNIGTHAEPDKILMNVVDNSHLHLDLFVFEQDLPKVKKGQNIDFTLTNLPGKNFMAKIFSIGSAFENQTKTIRVHAEITGDKTGLIEGMNVTGYINVIQTTVSSVITSAIVNSSGNDYIFIMNPGDGQQRNGKPEGLYKFTRIQVKKGITEGNYSEIAPLTQVPGGAKVVVNGAFYLLAMLTNAGEED